MIDCSVVTDEWARLRWRRAARTGLAGVVVLVIALTVAFGWVDWRSVGRELRPVAVELVLFGLAVALLGAATSHLLPGRRPTPTVSWWAVAAAGAVVVAVAWGATSWLLAEAGRAKDPAAARVEAIKTGLSIGAGTGGVFALLLAVRRQWHQELTSADTALDASERRVTELYTRAADQLGSDKAPVRLAGLYALERLGQSNPGQRQTIVDVLCAYLRMPYEPPAATAANRYDTAAATPSTCRCDPNWS